jgi:hypothetical protein
MTVYSDAYLFRDATITIDDTDYANQITKARLVPDTPIQTVRTLVPDGVIQDVDSTVWSFEITGVQSKSATTSLAAALNTAKGTQVDCVLTPSNGSGNVTASFTIVAVPVDFGGDQGAINTYDATFPVVGQPVFATVTTT